MADALGLGPSIREDMGVRVSPLAPFDFFSKENRHFI